MGTNTMTNQTATESKAPLWLNGEQELVERGRESLLGRREDIERLQSGRLPEDQSDEEPEDEDERREVVSERLNEYPLCVDYFIPEGDKPEGFIRYQISWGGPSEELRFYFSQGATQPYRVEFVFLDWGVGVGFDVTGEGWVNALWEDWRDCGMIEHWVKAALTD